MAALQVEEKLKQWKAIDAEIQQLFTQKTQVLSQFNENTLVAGELKLISEEGDDVESSAVFKLIGPVLVTVDLEGAKENVNKRIEFIESELKKLDDNIAAKQGLQTTLGDEIAAAQTKVASEAADAARKVAAEVSRK
jgi:prefoldin beta subunit